MNERQTEQPTTIAQLGLYCQKQFTVLGNAIRRAGDCPESDELSSAAFLDELGRFRTWANSIGAISSGTSSLDHRVRHAEYLRNSVELLLADLKASLRDGLTKFIKSNLTATSVAQGEVDGSSLISGSETGFDMAVSGSLTFEEIVGSESSTPDDGLRAYYHEIKGIIDKLFDLSILMRGTSPNFRMSRASAYVERDEAGNEILPAFKQFVRFQLATQEQAIPEWLVDRLTEAVGTRRQQFYYQRAHSKHIADASAAFQEMSQIDSEPIATTGAAPFKTSKGNLSITKTNSPFISTIAKSRLTTGTFDTFATELRLEQEPGKDSRFTKPTRTEIAGRNIFPLPPPEKGPTETAFECCQCFYILPSKMRTHDLWRLFSFAFWLMFNLEPISSPTFAPTPVFTLSVINTISFSIRVKRGLRMSSLIVTNGIATLGIRTRRQPWYFRQRKCS